MSINKKEAMYWIKLYLSNQNYSGSTKRNYISTLKKYFDTSADINKILESNLELAIEILKKRAGTDNDKTLNEHFNRVRKFLSWYQTQNKIKEMYILDALTHKYINNTNPTVLSDKEIAVAMLSMTHEEQATFIAYLQTGIRKEEISQLTPQDFRESKQVNIYSSKTSTERSVYAISESVKEIVEEHGVKKFSTPIAMTKKFKKIMKDNDIYITFNILRHTFATNVANNGGNPMRLANIMGNSLEVVLNNYYHNNAEEIRNELSNIFNHKVNFKTKDAYIKYLEEKVRELENGRT